MNKVPDRNMSQLLWPGFVVAFVLGLTLITASAATVPPGFTESLVTGGLSNPTAMAFAPDGRLFVCEQGGHLRVIKDGTLLTTPFLSLTVDSQVERGLLGVAVDPNFAANQFIYVYYTAPTPSVHNRVSRFTANGDIAVTGSEVTILDLDNLSTATDHNGGALHFGPDGKLYIGVGDNANSANSQTLSNLLGKILRINSDGTIPSDNPFLNSATGVNRAIWALGLRNPFTFAFQPGSALMFINDVGQNTWEEIDVGLAGANYGWPTCEGVCSNPDFVDPIFSYGHGIGSTTGCAIVGGAFYNPPVKTFPREYTGTYFFADLCSGWIRKLDPASGNAVTTFATGVSQPVDLQVAADGSLYYLARGTSEIHRVQFTSGVASGITSNPASQTVSVGVPATFSVGASGSLPLSFQWQRNGFDIPGATASSYTLNAAALSDDGAPFRVVVTNAFGTATSSAATLTVVNWPFVEFSSSSYLVGEGGKSVLISVRRSGDVSGSSSVDYATSNNTAQERSDYTTAIGTLRFAAGETLKTFPIFITDDLYVEGTEFANLALSDPSAGTTLGSQNTAQLVITDNDTTQPTTNPADQSVFFVRQHYLDFFGREPDDGGLAYWSGQIDICDNDQQCIRNRRIDVSAAFFVETEFQDTGFFVIRSYRAAFGRRPTYIEFIRDHSSLQEGATLETQKQAFAIDFVQRSPFSAAYPLTLDGSHFVDALLLAVANSSALDLTGKRGELINEYNTGASQSEGRARVLRKLIEYAEYRQAEYNAAFVLAQYFGYLRRDPDDGGYQFWLDVLNNRVPNNYRGMVCAFLTSSEYQDRFSSVITRSNQDCGGP